MGDGAAEPGTAQMIPAPALQPVAPPPVTSRRRRRAGRRLAEPAPVPEASDPAAQAAQQLRQAYATGQLTIDELRDRLTAALRAEPGDLACLTEGLPPPAPRLGPRGGPSRRAFPLDMALLSRLAAITDPEARYRKAAAETDAAAARQETARQHRMLALVTAHVRDGISQVDCYSVYGGKSARRPFHQAVRQAPADLPDYGGAGEAMAEALRWQARYETARSTAETARMVRDREIRALTKGDYGPPVSNAALARDAGYSTSLIAQIRTAPIVA
jgi:hypothetical protein